MGRRSRSPFGRRLTLRRDDTKHSLGGGVGKKVERVYRAGALVFYVKRPRSWRCFTAEEKAHGTAVSGEVRWRLRQGRRQACRHQHRQLALRT